MMPAHSLLPRAARLALAGVVVFVFACGPAPSARAAAKITYERDVLPILRNRCLKCHNGDKVKAGLNLERFGTALKGSNNGPVLQSGDPDGSLMLRVILHSEEPTMPPNDKLPDTEIEVVRQWIAGGLLENDGSKAIVSNAPKVDLALNATDLGRPEGPPPMPGEVFAIDPYVQTERTSVSTALAASPWSPVVALGGQHQVLLYHTETLELLGIIPFPEAYPYDVKFSATGKLLVIGGGRSAQSGRSEVWDVTTGERIIRVSDDELDSVLATDLSPDQRYIAHGGPDRLVRIYSTRSGTLLHRIKKHTDWVTAVRFSPDGRYVATGDRNGGLQVWEAAVGKQVCGLPGHQERITSLVWASTNILLSAGEDGVAAIWDINEVKELKKWNAHNGGVLSLDRSMEGGMLVTCGRNQRAALWDANGGRKREFEFPGDLPSRAVATHDAKRVIATDWNGMVYVWNAADGKEVGRLSLNPPTAEQGLEAALARREAKRQEAQSAQVAKTGAEEAAQEAIERMASLRREAESAQEQARRQESKVKELSDALEKLTQTSQTEPGAEAEALEAEITEAKAALENAVKAARQAEEAAQAAANGPLAKEIEAAAQAVKDRQVEVDAAQSAVNAAQREVDLWTRKRAYSRYFKEFESLRVLQSTQSVMQARLEADQSTAASIEASLQSIRRSSEIRQAEWQREQEARKAELALRQSKLGELQTEWDHQTNRWGELRRNLVWAHEQTSSVKEQLRQAEEALRAATAALATLQKQQTALTERMTVWEEDLKRREEDGGILRRDLEQERAEAEQAAQAMRKAAEQSATLLREQEAKLAELRRELQVEAEQAEAQRAALTQLEPKLEATQSRVEELKAAYEKLKSP